MRSKVEKVSGLSFGLTEVQVQIEGPRKKSFGFRIEISFRVPNSVLSPESFFHTFAFYLFRVRTAFQPGYETAGDVRP